MAGAKKVTKVKKLFYHARQPCEEIFEICPYIGPIFMTVCSNFEHLFHFSVGTNQDGYYSKVGP